MKAIRLHAYGGPEQLHFEDAPEPAPSADQVLVRVQAASVNPFDLKLASGMFQKMIPMQLPYIPGGDFAGVVESTGDAVYGNCPHGAYAEFIAVSPKTIAPKPGNLSFTDCASVPVAAQTAWQGLFDHAHLEKGQTVLIHAAAGGVGTFAVQLAHWKGARVIATASGSHIEFVRSLGADVVIDYKTTPFESVGKNVDVVFDLVGGETQARSFAVLKPGGHLIATAQPPPGDEAKRRGVQAMMMNMQPTSQRLRKLAELLDQGTLQPIVSKTLPLAQAAEAWRETRSGHTRGKVVLSVPE
jgi:NADPH:quinone reductase-like Zn-dependent oxidoreductase